MIKLKSKLSYALYFLLALVFVGCTSRTHNYDWEWSKKQCEDKLGVRYYNPNSSGCMCNNGEYISRN